MSEIQIPFDPFVIKPSRNETIGGIAMFLSSIPLMVILVSLFPWGAGPAWVIAWVVAGVGLSIALDSTGATVYAG